MNDEVVVTPKDDGVSVTVSSASAPVQIDSIKVANMLGIPEADKDQTIQAKFVSDYFHKEGMTDADLMYAIKSVENRLGTLKLGESRLSKVYEYARIRKDIETNQKLLNEL
jgi:hypothetical protein